jgi:hypothetical protein
MEVMEVTEETLIRNSGGSSKTGFQRRVAEEQRKQRLFRAVSCGDISWTYLENPSFLCFSASLLLCVERPSSKARISSFANQLP